VMIRLAGREHVQAILRLAARLAIRLSRAAVDVSSARIKRVRERRTAPRAARPRRMSDRSDDGEGFGATWDVLAAA
jgi:hypothetical protein